LETCRLIQSHSALFGYNYKYVYKYFKDKINSSQNPKLILKE